MQIENFATGAGVGPASDRRARVASQVVAECAVAATDGLVTVTGPAGTVTTTMLRVARSERAHNTAMVVARTDVAARKCLAESTQGGTPELIMPNDVRAAQAEMRRAARAGTWRRWRRI